LRKKQVCLHFLALCAYDISRRTRFFHEFAFDNKALKTFESAENVQTSNVVKLSNLNSVTSLLLCPYPEI